MRRFAALLLTSALGFTAPAFAQDTQSASADTQATTTDAEEATNAGDIVVTATRRAETVSDIPIAVTAVSGDTLRNSGAFDIRQLNQLAPSLLVSSTGSEANGSARVRGVGTVGDNPGLESSVAVFIDGVYRSRSGIGLNELGEIDRVEVLRGPQGTLFGRNASAGLIHVISKKPSYELGGYGEVEYGNYDYVRVAGALTGGITETLAARVDGVYVKRDGFLRDVVNNVDVNNRNRFFVRGQLLWEPTSDLTVRLIGDYTRRDESCCAAVYLEPAVNPQVGGLLTPANPIINVLTALGQPASRFSDSFSRVVSVSPGRRYDGQTRDGGVSAEVNWNLGGAALTSITAYRSYKNNQGSDTDYSALDLLYREPGDRAANREFGTFTQELRLQGEAFDGKLDWLVGGFYAHETLNVTDNLRFGTQYGRFASCRLAVTFGLGLAPTSQGCLAAPVRAALAAGATPFGAAGGLILGGFDRLDRVNDVGSLNDRYRQTSENFAFFTHNIVHITDRLDLTLGLRYTNERKRFRASFENNNAQCLPQQQALGSLLTTPLAAAAGGLINLTCQGNSTSELTGVTIRDGRNESEFTGTAVLSYKPTDDLLVYGSYSRGYKAGGFNLDRSALKAPTLSFAAVGGAQALVGNLQFAQELNDAFEIGAKFSTRQFSLNVALFRQDFRNFQLNTFDGSVFLVQNVNGCSTDLGVADRDQAISPLLPNFNAAAATTGACAADQVSPGLRSEGVEVEASLRPSRYLSVALGYTYADTRFANSLVGTTAGAPLSPALRTLPGQLLSNAPQQVVTSALTWTPPIGNSGLTGLFYVDSRLTSAFNTGSDLFPQKVQPSFATVNARIGIRGDKERWSLEFWTQNAFNQNFTQVAFNSPFQAGPTVPAFSGAQFPGGTQIFSAYLGEPRTYGLTLRTRF